MLRDLAFETPVGELTARGVAVCGSDPFDTSIAECLPPGRAELRLLESELVGEPSAERRLSDPEFDPRAGEAVPIPGPAPAPAPLPPQPLHDQKATMDFEPAKGANPFLVGGPFAPAPAAAPAAPPPTSNPFLCGDDDFGSAPADAAAAAPADANPFLSALGGGGGDLSTGAALFGGGAPAASTNPFASFGLDDAPAPTTGLDLF
ncbi:Protein of unknown function, partial [Gryllus bimaculatus]